MAITTSTVTSKDGQFQTTEHPEPKTKESPKPDSNGSSSLLIAAVVFLVVGHVGLLGFVVLKRMRMMTMRRQSTLT